MIVSIEGGTTHVGEDYWEYKWTTVEGEHTIVFYAPIKPKIGDTVDSESLQWQPLTDWKINSDTSKWKPEEYDHWP